MPKCSVIIPVYNHASVTRMCLNSLLMSPPRSTDVEVIVVDDASTDITQEVLAAYGDRIRRVTHETNRGFATSCNDGAAIAAGDLLVFLNNDTIPYPGWLDALVRYADEHPEAAAIGCKMLFPDETVQHAGVVIAHQDRIPRHIYRGFPSDHPAVNRSRRFQIVTAACVLIRRSAFEDIEGFDAAFINGYEDVDLCLRLGERGHEVHYCHESVLVHLESATRSGRSAEAIHNTKLYRDRWMERVQPDDIEYFIADGLIDVAYPDHDLYPLSLRVSPHLAVLNRDHRDQEADRLLTARARQIWRMSSENVGLLLRLQQLTSMPQATPQARVWLDTSTGATAPPVEACVLSDGKIHSPAGGTTGRLVSIIMPVKNGARELEAILSRVLSQRTKDRIEIIAIDSGSTDATVSLLEKAGARVLQIDPSSFDHGLTRLLAARQAHGDVYVFLNQTATPVDDEWLQNLIAPLDADGDLAGVCSRVVPRPDADPLTRRDVLRDPSGSTERSVRSLTSTLAGQQLDPHQLRLAINFHTVSAAIRPSVFLRIPFRAVRMGEDLLWAREVLEAGFKLQHEPTSRVYHSHAYSHFELLQRNIDDGLANRQIVGRDLEAQGILPLLGALVRDDWRFLAGECGMDGDDLTDWQLEAALRRAAQVLGQWIGANGDRATAQIADALSLTRTIKGATRDPGRSATT